MTHLQTVWLICPKMRLIFRDALSDLFEEAGFNVQSFHFLYKHFKNFQDNETYASG